MYIIICNYNNIANNIYNIINTVKIDNLKRSALEGLGYYIYTVISYFVFSFVFVLCLYHVQAI